MTQPHPSNQHHRALIIGGHNVPKHRYPYFVSLDRRNGVVVSGALIAPDIVLSAGHVVINGLGPMTLKIGTYSLSQDAPSDYEQIAIEGWIRHPGWDQFVPERFANDVVIMKLANSSTIDPVAINRDDSFPESGDDVVMMGLGWTVETIQSPSDIVQETTVNVVSNKDCEATEDPSRNISYHGQIDPTMICTMEPKNTTRDGCAWDSGGPIIVAGDEPQRDILVALGSTGVACADPVFPAIQARISAVADWIDGMVCQLSADPPSDFTCPKHRPATMPPAMTVVQVPTIEPTQAPVPAPFILQKSSSKTDIAFIGIGVLFLVVFIRYFMRKGSQDSEEELVKLHNRHDYGSISV